MASAQVAFLQTNTSNVRFARTFLETKNVEPHSLEANYSKKVPTGFGFVCFLSKLEKLQNIGEH